MYRSVGRSEGAAGAQAAAGIGSYHRAAGGYTSALTGGVWRDHPAVLAALCLCFGGFRRLSNSVHRLVPGPHLVPNQWMDDPPSSSPRPGWLLLHLVIVQLLLRLLHPLVSRPEHHLLRPLPTQTGGMGHSRIFTHDYFPNSIGPQSRLNACMCVLLDNVLLDTFEDLNQRLTSRISPPNPVFDPDHRWAAFGGRQSAFQKNNRGNTDAEIYFSEVPFTSDEKQNSRYHQ